MSNNYANSSLINNLTYLINTRQLNVKSNDISQQQTGHFKGKSGTYTLAKGSTWFPLREGAIVIKSPERIESNVSLLYNNGFTLKDGTAVKDKAAPTEVKIGDYYYYLDCNNYKYLTQIRGRAFYRPFNLKEALDHDLTFEWFRLYDEVPTTDGEFKVWFESLPTLTSTKVLYLCNYSNYPISDETKKIATDKGWTLA